MTEIKLSSALGLLSSITTFRAVFARQKTQNRPRCICGQITGQISKFEITRTTVVDTQAAIYLSQRVASSLHFIQSMVISANFILIFLP